MNAFVSNWRFSILLAALLLNMLLAPMFVSPNVNVGIVTLDIAFTILLVVIVFTVGHNKKTYIAYLILALITIAFTWAGLIYEAEIISIYRNLFSIIILTVAMILVIKEVFTGESVTTDTINGALCAYLLLGFTFISVYALIDILDPQSFLYTVNATPLDLSQHESALERIYFSFITMLTVGYGDIVPHSSTAKFMTVIQAFFGQVYLVVMIARLVGMHVSQNSSNS